MKIEVGMRFNYRGGQTGVIISITRNVPEWPIVSMNEYNGDVNFHRPGGAGTRAMYDLMPLTKKVNGWIGVRVPKSTGSTWEHYCTCIYTDQEELQRVLNDSPNYHKWKIVPVSFDIEEQQQEKTE